MSKAPIAITDKLPVIRVVDDPSITGQSSPTNENDDDSDGVSVHGSNENILDSADQLSLMRSYFDEKFDQIKLQLRHERPESEVIGKRLLEG